MKEREIFLTAHRIGQAEERESFLESACRGDRALYERILDLLRSADGVGSFLESPAPALVAALDPPDEAQACDDGSPMVAAGGLEAGTLGDFRILDEIGRGGMGVVYEAEQISLGRRVALKVLSYASILDKTKLERFKIEARAAASLDHPNVVHVHSVGSQRGVHYYAMQFIEGQTVADVIADERCRRGLDSEPGQPPAARGSSPDDPAEVRSVTKSHESPFPEAIKDTSVADRTSAATVGSSEEKERIRRAVKLAIQAAEALEHAHRMGIVHRDIKPSNLLVDEEQHLWVADFGLAMIEAEGNLTATGSLMGTFRYMSPEQIQGDRHVLDHHTDIYSLGATLYEMLTLRAAFPESAPARLVQQIPTAEATAPRNLHPAVPRDLETIVLKAMAKDREDRYASAGELANDLQSFLDDEPISAKPPGVVDRAKKWVRRHRAVAYTVTATLLVAMAVAGGLLWRERSRTLAAYAAEREQHVIALRNEAQARRHAEAANLARAAEAEAREAAEREKEKALAVQAEAETVRMRAEHEALNARASERFAQQMVYAGDVRLAAQAWENGDVRHYTDLLDRFRADEGLRGFEWSYLRQLGKADYRNLAERTGGTCCVRHSRAGRFLVTGQHDGSISLWDGRTQEILADWQGHDGLVRGIDFAPGDDRMVSIGDDGRIRLWSLPDCEEILSIQAYAGIGFDAFFALGGTILVSCGEEPEVRLWDPTTGESLGALSTENKEFTTLSVSCSGRYVVGSGGGITLTWDLQERERIWGFPGPVVRCVRFSPDEKVFAAGANDKVIRMYNVQSGETIATFEGHRDDVEDLSFHPSGGLLASSDRAGVIRTWEVNVGEASSGRTGSLPLAKEASSDWPPCFRAHTSRTWSVDFSPDGKHLLSGSNDGTVRSWSGRPPVLRCLQAESKVRDIAYVAGGEDLLICEEARIREWSRSDRQERTFSCDIPERKCSLAVAPDSETVACGDALGGIHFWSRKEGRIVANLRGHTDAVDKIDFSPDGRRMITASWDGTAKLWDVERREELAVFDVGPHCYDAAFAPDGKCFAISSEDEAMLYDVASRQRLRLLQGHQNTAACLAFSPDGAFLATGSHDRTVRLWDLETGEARHVVPAHRDKITAVAFSPDGRTVASGDEKGTVAFSHVETGRFLYTLKVADGTIHALEFSEDGEGLAVAADDQAVLLQIAGDPFKQGQANDSDLLFCVYCADVCQEGLTLRTSPRRNFD